MADQFSAECGMTGCPYVAEGTSLRQTAARLTAHWTLAKDHDEHIRTVIESSEPGDQR